MVLRINTNIAALTANRHLGVTDFKLSKTLERLSSGYRINRSADDAAGLAIVEKMSTQTRGIAKALDNAQMGINFMRTAEGGVSELENIVQRIRELVIQAANDTNVRSDREKIQLEIDELMTEFDRLPLTTNFNQKLPLQIPPEILAKLDPQPGGPADISYIIDTSGSMSGPIANVQAQLGTFIANLQAANIDFRISVSRINRNQGGGGAGGDNVTTTLDSSSNAATIQSAINDLSTQGSLIDPLNALLEVAGATRTAAEAAVLGGVAGDTYDNGNDDAVTRRSGVGYFQILVTDTDPEAFQGDLTLDVPGGAAYPGGNDDPARFDDTATILQRHGVNTFVVSDAGDAPAYTNLANTLNGQSFNTIAGGFSNDLNTISQSIIASVSAPQQFVVDRGGIQIQIGANEGQTIGIDRYHVNRTRMGLNTVNVLRFSDLENVVVADKTVLLQNLEADIFGQIDLTLERLASMRAHYGAVENRLQSTVANLSITNENLTASRSRILDTDYASETANLTRMQILQQAGTAVVSQANVAPQSALSLLG